MILLKLGGSVVTDKSKPRSIRVDVIKRLALEIKESGKKLVVVHGGGSFGHPIASKYGIQDGLKDSSQRIGVVKTRMAMEDLNQRIVRIFSDAGLPAVSIQTSAVFICEDKRIKKADIEIVEGFLKLGFMPVLYGDVVLDRSLGVSILSGDQITAFLARELHPERVILATDVDGVLDDKGRLIEHISPGAGLSGLGRIASSKADVTGGMKGKAEELLRLAKGGTPSIVLNAMEEERLKNALLGKRTKGTAFEVD